MTRLEPHRPPYVIRSNLDAISDHFYCPTCGQRIVNDGSGWAHAKPRRPR